jgi:hypothetical protein
MLRAASDTWLARSAKIPASPVHSVNLSFSVGSVLFCISCLLAANRARRSRPPAGAGRGPMIPHPCAAARSGRHGPAAGAGTVTRGLAVVPWRTVKRQFLGVA